MSAYTLIIDLSVALQCLLGFITPVTVVSRQAGAVRVIRMHGFPGDIGRLQQNISGEVQRQCDVKGTVKAFPGAIACRVIAEPATGGDNEAIWLPEIGDAVTATVCGAHRRGCRIHHTATHMLAAALRAVLPVGTSLVQVISVSFTFSQPTLTQYAGWLRRQRSPSNTAAMATAGGL